MAASVLSFEDLKELTGYDTPASLAAHLASKGIAFERGKHGRPYTTLTAMNVALLGESVAVNRDEFNPSDIEF